MLSVARSADGGMRIMELTEYTPTRTSRKRPASAQSKSASSSACSAGVAARKSTRALHIWRSCARCWACVGGWIAAGAGRWKWRATEARGVRAVASASMSAATLAMAL